MNSHIAENLNNYITSSLLEYAVLISGKRGSGKAHFINNFIKNYSLKNKKVIFIKISLFGISDIDEINKSIMFSLLNINENKLIGSVLNIKDITIAQIIDNIDNIDEEIVFVFDDLDSSKVELSELLGHINKLVEQLNNKVILLANEENFASKEESKSYKDFKEKVIGKTYEVIQNFDDIYIQFIENTKHSKKVLIDNSSLIKSIYKDSTYDNLRHTRQAIIDFDYFYESINSKYRSNAKFIRSIIKVYFMLFIEIRIGSLSVIEFNKVSEPEPMENEKVENASIYGNILKKYNFSEYSELYLQKETWIAILFKNQLDANRINKELSKASCFS